MNTKIFTKIGLVILFTFSFSFLTFGQTPEMFKYQAVLRDASGNILANQSKTVVIDILQTSPSGTSVFTESHSVTTTAQGLINLNIGSVENLSGINWGSDEYFIQIKVDGTIMGTSQLLSVPYALYAKTAESVTSNSTLNIGDYYQGGIIFWLDVTGQHGLIAATVDQSTDVQWYNGVWRYTGTTSDGLNGGAMNTAIIVASQLVDDQAGSFAALVCADYSITDGNIIYGDWYLPSKFELNLLYQQKDVVGGFAMDDYWSSSEYQTNSAWYQSFSDGTQAYGGKHWTNSVRAIRAF